MLETSKRSRRVADLIQHEIAFFLKKEVNDPRLNSLSISAVRVTNDLRTARIYFSLLNTDSLPDVMTALQKANGFLRHCLAERTKLRYVPRLEFLYDENLLTAEKVTHLINKVNPDDIS